MSMICEIFAGPSLLVQSNATQGNDIEWFAELFWNVGACGSGVVPNAE
jgi:hypothetical protein